MMEQLRNKGWARFPFTIDPKPVRDYLETQEKFRGPHIRANMYDAFLCFHPMSVIRAPILMDLFNRREVIDLMRAWIGQTPCLYSINCWWSLAGKDPQCWHNQEWHVDTDEDNFLCLFVYLTDVDMDGGPQQVGTEDNSILGPAGTVFVTNTLHTHRGLAPTKLPRLCCWARYGTGPNTNSADLDEVTPVPVAEIPTQMTGTAEEREINRLLIDFGG